MLKGKWDIEINRFYLSKPDLNFVESVSDFYAKGGQKLRPIGAPKGASRVKASMVMDALLLFGMKAPDWQHAYFPCKGVHTAVMDIWEK